MPETEPFKELQPVFINTRNVGRAKVAMNALALMPHKPRFAAFIGRAGVGKSYWATTYIAQQPELSPYLKCQWVWVNSELEFARALCRAFNIKEPPKRKVACYQLILDEMTARPHLPLFIDDFHRMKRSPGHLEILRDLTEISGAPIVLIGEEPLKDILTAQTQVWSRTKQTVEFKPNEVADAVMLFEKAAGLHLEMEAAVHLHDWTTGDFRFLENALAGCLQKAQGKTKDRTVITLEDLKAVLKTMLAPRVGGRK